MHLETVNTQSHYKKALLQYLWGLKGMKKIIITIFIEISYSGKRGVTLILTPANTNCIICPLASKAKLICKHQTIAFPIT